MKLPLVGECMTQEFIKVLADDRPNLHSTKTMFAIFDTSTETGMFLGLVTTNDIARQPTWKFNDFVTNRYQPVLKMNTSARRALAIMTKEKTDALPVLDAKRNMMGVVTRDNLLQALYQHEHTLLLKARKHIQSLLLDNIHKQEAVLQAQERISHMAHSDHLTGLPHFAQIRDKIKRLLSQAHQHQQQGAILLINLDNFRNINDMVGSHFGDLILKLVSARITSSLREKDLLARKGGDEFIIVLFDISSVEEAALMAKRMLDVLTHPFLIEDQEVYVTASIGISCYPMNKQNIEVMLAHADIALEQAKEDGKNNYQIFIQDMAEKAYGVQKKEKYLRLALSRDELHLCYQPQIEYGNNRIVGMEALIRWQSTELGLIFPNEFIPLAESTGLIIPIGDWVLRTACKQAKMWQQQNPTLRIAINISARQFQENLHQETNSLVDSIQSILAETKIPPELLEIEITESTIMKNYAAAMISLKKLKNLGIRISCDDFGTGYSSLNYLKRFPIDTIKIDKSFIDDLAYDADDIAIIRAILFMAEELGIDVIAEGVENKTQLDILADLGCTIVQGYYYSKPVHSNEASTLLQNGLTLKL